MSKIKRLIGKKTKGACLMFKVNKIFVMTVIVVFIGGCALTKPKEPVDRGIVSGEPVVADPDEPVSIQPGETPALPGDEPVDLSDKVRGNVYINKIDILIMESYPIQVALSIDGELPTPCNHFVSSISDPNNKNEIHVELYSVSDPKEDCIQVLEPISVNVPIHMDGAPDGTYTIWVNGENIGEFNYPGG